jgi:acyl-CoA reductase-like NAD-dependent aldehyde dehydrogenase
MTSVLPALADEIARIVLDLGRLPDGAFVDGETVSQGDRFDVYDPGSGMLLATLPQCNADVVDRAAKSARAALSGEWGQMKPAERARLIAELARRIRADANRLSLIETLDSGKPLREAKGDIETAARYFEYYAGVADKLQGETIPLGSGFMSWTIREPVGVTAHIIPWNFPLVTCARGLAPALAAGCTAVLKPSELTSLTAILLAELMHNIGFPKGVCSVVTGFGDPTGAALVSHPQIDHVTFTGSVGSGQAVMRAAAANVTAVTLELGGKSPVIALSDAPVDAVVDGAYNAIMLNAGQVCSAGSRLVVARGLRDEVVDRLAARMAAARPDHGLRDGATGSVISAGQLQRIGGFVGRAKEAGVGVLAGGQVASVDGFATGQFFEPTLLDSRSPEDEVVQEEIFGPVLTVQTAADDAEALALANGTKYGLVAGVYARDVGRALAIARDVCAGQVFINQYFAGGVETPFGGNRMSGFGREKGMEAVQTYLRTKCITAKVDP